MRMTQHSLDISYFKKNAAICKKYAIIKFVFNILILTHYKKNILLMCVLYLTHKSLNK